MIQSYTKKEIALIANKRRDEYSKQKYRRGLYKFIMGLVLQYARSGKQVYIHPIDRVLWNDEEIEYTKWKLRERGFSCVHKYYSRLSMWMHPFTNNYEQLVVEWEMNSNN